jgi:macrolide-specific efflux system membrane fusion protein
MVIRAEISEADVVKVQPGQRVYFTILGEPDNNIEATLREVEPAPTSIADETTQSGSNAVYYNGLFDVPNPDHRLRISMTASVTIVLDEASDVLTLPSSLVTQRGPQGTMVMVYDPATEATTPVAVEVGLNDNISAEIRSGLEEGQMVVNATGARLGNGGGGGGGPGGGRGGLGGGMMMRGG